MAFRSLIFILIVTSSFVLAAGQTPDANKAAKTTGAIRNETLRDIPFPNGIDLKFLITELARELDLNVLFDADSFRVPRKTSVELKNVTVAAALEYILRQEGLIFEEAGPKTILVASRAKAASIPQIGVGVTPMTEQLAQYFGVQGGILVNNVRPDSPASKAGLKAGDVIVEIDGVPIRGVLSALGTINDKNAGEVTLKLVRNRKSLTINLTPEKGIK